MDSSAPSPAASLREQIARIIDPPAFGPNGSPAFQAGALRKADEIAALPALREAAAPAQVDALADLFQEAAEIGPFYGDGDKVNPGNITVDDARRIAAALRARSASPAPAPIITREKVLAILHDAASDVDAADKIVRRVALASMIRAAEEDGLYDRPWLAGASPAPTQPEGSETA